MLRRQTVRLIVSNRHIFSRKCSMILEVNLLDNVRYRNSLMIQKRLHFHSKKNDDNLQIAETYVNKEKRTQPNQLHPSRYQLIQLNTKISNAANSNEILRLIEHILDKNAGGGLLNHVVFTTIISCLARHLSRNKVERNIILNDTRFSLLFACLAEALVSDNESNGDSKCNNNNNLSIQFDVRGMSKIGWAIAKLRVTVPSSKLPLLQVSMQKEDSEVGKKSNIIDESSQTILSTAQRIRESVSMNTTNLDRTILAHDSELTTLASHMLDYIGILVAIRIKNAAILGHSHVTTEMSNLQFCSNLLWAWAKAGRADPIVFEPITLLMTCRIYELIKAGKTEKPQHISMALWAMATANVYQGQQLVEYMESVAQLMQNHNSFLKKCTSQNFSNSAWAVSKLVANQHSLKERNGLNDGDSPGLDVTNKIKQSALTIISIVAMEVIQRKATGFKAQELSNTAWAFATVDFKDTVLIRNATQYIIEESIRILPEFIDQNASNLVWSVAQVFESKSSTIDTLFQRLGNKLLDRSLPVYPQDISMTLLGFTKLGFTDDSLYRGLACRFFTNKGALLEPQWISNVMRALTTAGITVQCDVLASMVLPSQSTSETRRHDQVSIDPVLHCCAVAANEFIRRPHEFSTQSIANLCWSLATLRVKDTTFLKKVENEIKFRISSTEQGKPHVMKAFNGQEIGNILWSFGTLNYVDSNIIQYFEPYVFAMCKGERCQNIQTKSVSNFFVRQNLANIAWACAVFGKFPDELMKILYLGLFGSGALEDIHYLSKIHGDGGLNIQESMALVQTQIAMGLTDSKNGLSLPSNFPEAWMRCDGSSTLESSKIGLIVLTSNLQKDVSKSLKSIGFNHVMEHSISMKDLADNYLIDVPRMDMNIFSIDIADVEKKIAIEVDGPSHFAYTIDSDSVLKTGKSYSTSDFSMHEPNGSTMLKRRLLTSMGWTVLTVPHWEWYLMKGNHQKQQQYCHRLLNMTNTE